MQSIVPWLLWTPLLGQAVGRTELSTFPNRCPRDMAFVRADHPETVTHTTCNTVKWGTCTGFESSKMTVSGPVRQVNACMDIYEAPNIKGARPYVMKSGEEAGNWCHERGKRLCTEYEWESACEGPEHLPFGYGWSADESCNTQRAWKPFNASLLMQGGTLAELETERLWQGDTSGDRATCTNIQGVHDLLGNAEEWVTASRRYKYPLVLMGGHWAKPWQKCRMTNYAHEPFFRFYEVGFRCCSDPT